MKKSRLFRLVALVAAMMCALGMQAAEAYANYTSSNRTLTFYYDNQRRTRTGTTYDLNTGTNKPGWNDDGNCQRITSVVFDPSFADARPTTTVSWFDHFYYLTSITGMKEYLNTSEVTNMREMFYYCGNYANLPSLDLSGFNTSNVTDMSYMFNCCGSLTSLNLSSFNTANVTKMQTMFYGCSNLSSLDLSGFSTSNVTHMGYMFYGCSNLTAIYAGSAWSTAAVISSDNMFYGCTSLVGGMGTTYDASHVNKAYAHIDGGTANPGYFTGKVAYACYTPSDSTLTFYYDDQRYNRSGTTYDLNTGNDNPSWYTDATCSAVSQVVFDPSFAGARPTTAYRWFYWMTHLKSIAGMEYLNTSEVTNMSYMFYYCWNLTNPDLSNFNTSKVTTMSYMFRDCYQLTSLDLSSFNTSNVTTMSYMFYHCNRLTSLDLSSFNTAKVTSMNYMFYYCPQLVTIYAGQGWNTNAVTSSDNMFQLCSRLVGGKGTTYDANHLDKEYARIDGGSSNPGYLTDNSPGAYACYTPSNRTLTFYYDALRGTRTGTTYDLNEGINAPAPEWFSDGTRSIVTSVKFDPSFADARPTTTFRWFEEMHYLTSITGMEYLNTSEVTDMTNMFQQCEALNSLDVSHFNTSKVTTMYSMFCDCYSLMSLDLSHFKTENVTDMSFMFSGCTGLTSLDLSSFNVTGYVETFAMFGGCTSLNTIYASDVWNTVDLYGPVMFVDCTALVGGKGTTYDENHVDQEYAHIDGGPSNPGYFTAKVNFTRGDVNGDGMVNITDATALIMALLNENFSNIIEANADMDGNGSINITDSTLLISQLLNN